MAEATGVAAAVQAAHREAPAPVDGAEQLPLAGLPLAAKGAELQATPERERGTRKGVPNKRTQAWVDFILSRYQSPLVALAETMSRPVTELCAELACTRLEAFQLQIRAMSELAPYLHQKLPQALSIEAASGVALLNINLPPLPPADAEDADAKPLLDMKPTKSEG